MTTLKSFLWKLMRWFLDTAWGATVHFFLIMFSEICQLSCLLHMLKRLKKTYHFHFLSYFRLMLLGLSFPLTVVFIHLNVVSQKVKKYVCDKISRACQGIFFFRMLCGYKWSLLLRERVGLNFVVARGLSWLSELPEAVFCVAHSWSPSGSSWIWCSPCLYVSRPHLDPRIDTIISLRQGPKEAHGWVDVGKRRTLSSSGGIPLDTVTTLLKAEVLWICGSSLSSEFPKTFSRQDGWYILRTEQRHRTERQSRLRRQSYTLSACGFSARSCFQMGRSLFYAGSAARARLSHSW